ncbi:MAG: NUDIX domain-containing protein [Flavobacteriales bacterium]|nr:NUDIX domain-containing protein [Flavobacteriales bacterium]
MQRKYTVWIEGKPVEIIDGVPERAVQEHWLTVNVRGPADLERALKALPRAEVLGVRLFSAHGVDAWHLFSAPYHFVHAAGGLVQDEAGRLLVIKRLGVWDLPKGKLDRDEEVEHAAVREVQEECGLKHVRIVGEMPSTWHTYMRKGADHLKRTDWFLMASSAAETLTPQSEEDIEEVRWMTRSEVELILAETYPSLRPVLEAWLEQR